MDNDEKKVFVGGAIAGLVISGAALTAFGPEALIEAHLQPVRIIAGDGFVNRTFYTTEPAKPDMGAKLGDPLTPR